MSRVPARRQCCRDVGKLLVHRQARWIVKSASSRALLRSRPRLERLEIWAKTRGLEESWPA